MTVSDTNVAYCGPLRGTNVFFKIPNGSIASFDKKLRENVPQAGELTITYDDNGYEDVMPSLKRTRLTAILTCVAGSAASVAAVIFLLYFFIAKESRRTAIERGLGMSKRQCYVSLVSGILVLALIGTVLGSGLGLLMIGRADINSSKMEDEKGMYSVYSTQYSDWTSKWSSVAQAPENDDVQAPLVALTCTVPLALVIFIFALSMVMVNFNLRIEPIELLGGKTIM